MEKRTFIPDSSALQAVPTDDSLIALVLYTSLGELDRSPTLLK